VRAVPARGVQQRLCACHRDSCTQGTAALRQATGQRIRAVSTESTTGWNIKGRVELENIFPFMLQSKGQMKR